MFCAVIAATAFTGRAAGQTAPPLGDGSYGLDISETSVLGSTQVVGLAGAFTAIAEGTVAIPFNPAAVANRPYYSNDWWDWDYNWNMFAAGVLQGDDFDFDNSGEPSGRTFLAFAVGGDLQFGDFGVGLYFRGQNSTVKSSSDPSLSIDVGSWQGHLALAYGLLDHTLIVGAALRLGMFRLRDTEDPFGGRWGPGLGASVGALYRSRRLPLRIGASFASPLADLGSLECEGDDCPEDVVLPTAVAAGWELRIGAMWHFAFDGQVYNPRPDYRNPPAKASPPSGQQGDEPAQDAEAKKEDAEAEKRKDDLDATYRGGRYIIVAAELAMIGPVSNALGRQGFLTQTELWAGESLSVSPRLGIDAEVVRRRLRLRAGTYWEPSRYSNRTGRMHGTFSLLVRMFDLKIPLIGRRGICFDAGLDMAQAYSNITASVLTFWH